MSADLKLHAFNIKRTSLNLTSRIKVEVYEDAPCYLAVYLIDGEPLLKEVMIDNIKIFLEETLLHTSLHDFLIEYTLAHPC